MGPLKIYICLCQHWQYWRSCT